MQRDDNPLSWQYVRVPLAVILCFSFFTVAILAGSTLESQPAWRRLLIPMGFAALFLPFWIAALFNPAKFQDSDSHHTETSRGRSGPHPQAQSPVAVVTSILIGLTCFALFAGNWTLGGSVFVLFLFLVAVWSLRR